MKDTSSSSPSTAATTAQEGDKRSIVEIDIREIGPSIRWATATVTKTPRADGGWSYTAKGASYGSMSAASLGGLRSEPAARAGVCHLLSQALLGGTRRLSATDIARQVDALGGQLDGFAGRSSWGLQGEFLSRHRRAGLEPSAGRNPRGPLRRTYPRSVGNHAK